MDLPELLKKYFWLIGLILLLLLLGGGYYLSQQRGPQMTLAPQASPAAEETAGAMDRAYQAFGRFNGTYSGTWEDIGQGRSGTMSATFRADPTAPFLSVTVNGIPDLPFTGPQSGEGFYNQDGSLTFATEAHLYGTFTINATPDGTITASGGDGLPFGITALEGSGTLDPDTGLVFDYTVSQAPFSFQAKLDLKPAE